jgi:hypothetical protein
MCEFCSGIVGCCLGGCVRVHVVCCVFECLFFVETVV